ncbi:hypothetical protein JTB14_013737 [Gonioctena quinquepunctata]|nr:hypothetical protein JTB14_013737 [Gonioctena quinquepunctata]
MLEMTWLTAICISNFVILSNCAIKSFNYDNDIYNPHNWVGEKTQETCEGLIFNKFSYGNVNPKKLQVENIVFPRNHLEITLGEDFEIDFVESSNSPMNCVELKELRAYHWADPSIWETLDKKDNTAIPHVERLPCQHDDVVLPGGIDSSSIMLFEETVVLKSFRFGNEQWTNQDLIDYSRSELIQAIIITSGLGDAFEITNKTCEDLGGCLCGNEQYFSRMCDNVQEFSNFDCLNPVLPIGFCTEICGASILAEPSNEFKIAEMEKILQTFNSDTYVSRVKNSTGQELIQIIFTEKEFTGDSLDEAQSLHQQISTDPSLRLKRAVLQSSGAYYREGGAGKGAAGIIFGTLFGVLLVFVAVYLVYSPDGPAATLRNRLNIGSRPIPSFTTRFFTRYNSVGENAGLIFEGRSMAGSVVSLDKAFENPLYGKEEGTTSSTSTTSNVTNVSSESKETRSESEIENKMFSIGMKNEEVENVADEGELVDLTN